MAVTALGGGSGAVGAFAIKELTDDRQQAYEEIRAMAVHPQCSYLSRPRTRLEDYATVDENEQVGVAPLASLHLMADEGGDFPLGSLNEWERQVVRAELARDGVRGWYRNPPRQAVDSIGIAYRDAAGNWRSMHPDFVFFHEVGGTVRASIIDPHSHHLDDAVAKLRALVDFASKYGDQFHRIEALSAVNGQMRVLDMQLDAVREAVYAGGQTPVDLYASSAASEYDS